MNIDEKQLRELLLELNLLRESCKTDFQSKIWGNWPRYVNEFNRLRSNQLILKYSEISDIADVPSRELSTIHGVGGGVPAEKAKLREIESQTTKIIHKLELDYPKPKEKLQNKNATEALELIFNKFHSVVVQLRNRYDGRPTIDVDDEYDVQDLLHALLKLFFKDIRKEEWTPSYAGKATRMDYLLKNEKIVIEVKKTRLGIKDKDIGNQLIDDIAHYKEHRDCEILYCFVYDPENRIINPIGLENDLNKSYEKVSVRVVVRPSSY